jgi:putative acetyltransferase
MSAAPAQTKLGLRPYLPEDAPLLAEIFRASVEELTGDDYDPAQQRAWVAVADDEAAFTKRLGNALTLVATMQGEPVGFASLAGGEKIDLLYVHPVAIRRGVAALLVDALEKLAASRGAKRLTADASDTSLGFYEHRGFVPTQRNTVRCNGEWFANTTVEKKLADAKVAP